MLLLPMKFWARLMIVDIKLCCSGRGGVRGKGRETGGGGREGEGEEGRVRERGRREGEEGREGGIERGRGEEGGRGGRILDIQYVR